ELPSPASLPLARPAVAPASALASDAPPRTAATREAERGMSWLAWALIALALGSIGFVGWRLTHPAPEGDAIEGPLPPEEPSRVAGAPTDPDDPVADPPPEEEPESIAIPAPWGREQEGLALEGVDVPEGQGLLVLEPGAAPMTVTVGEHE